MHEDMGSRVTVVEETPLCAEVGVVSSSVDDFFAWLSDAATLRCHVERPSSTSILSIQQIYLNFQPLGFWFRSLLACSGLQENGRPC